MTLKIKAVAGPGNISKERVVLRADQDLDLDNYAIFRCNIDRDGDVLSGDVSDVYWWSTAEIKLGDFVVLYTKKGTRSRKPNADGSTSHFFYWNRADPLWASGKRATCVYTPSWSAAPKEPELPEE